MAKTRNRVFLGILTLTGLWLAGCAAPATALAPAPRRDNFYIERDTYRPRKPKSPDTAAPKTPAATPVAGPAAEAAPGVQPETPGQLPAAAQSPVAVPPAGGLPHDASQYIEPPSR
jgi:hypothetical protein